MADIAKCKQEIQQLNDEIRAMRQDPDSVPLSDLSKNQGASSRKELRADSIKQRRILKGHFGKIYAMHWANNSQHLVSASQDGKLIVWNGFTTNKAHAVPLRSSWVMTCAYSASGDLVACGGLDNLCSVYKLSNGQNPQGTGPAPQKTFAELAQHEGYLSCCRFIGDNEIITSSGDSTCILWDVQTKVAKNIFSDHSGDVMSVSIFPQGSCFVSGSCDTTAKLWDYRTYPNSPVKTFQNHESDINSVQMFPDGNAFGTGSDDSSCRLFDVRAYGQINKYADDKILCGITSVAFSHSGKFLFAGYDDYNAVIWDTLTADALEVLQGHDNRVSCLGVSPDGKALCTGSWDTLLKIWA